jgi:ABC-type branched-subunit amino acid transport system ATPase component
MLRDLTIENYRLFRELTLEPIARVNLIVGPNNSGKSSLLEAIYLLASEGTPASLLDILNERGEFVVRSFDPRYERRPPGGYQVVHMFYGHELKSGNNVRIQSKLKKPISLTIAFVESAPRQQSTFEELEQELDDMSYSWVVRLDYTQNSVGTTHQELPVLEDGLLDYPRRPLYRRFSSPDQKVKLITTNYLNYDELAMLWDKITLTPREEKVVEALQLLEPKVERISFTSRLTSNSGILLKLRGVTDPVPLGSMGDGIRRILAIAASLVSVENGILLVDEIDTGLYYEALTNIWRLILETSVKRNVQVFATTHSWDCVKSFQEALSEVSDECLGFLIRLEPYDDQIRAVVYSRDELRIAIHHDIEVR